MSSHNHNDYEQALDRARRRLEKAHGEDLKLAAADLIEVHRTRGMSPHDRRTRLRTMKAMYAARDLLVTRNPELAGNCDVSMLRKHWRQLIWRNPILAFRILRLPHTDKVPVHVPATIQKAALAGELQSLHGLLEEVESPVLRSEQAGMALAAIAEQGTPSTDVINVLIDAGAELEQRHCSGRTPLIIAAIHGQAAIVEALLEIGADPLARFHHEVTQQGSPIMAVPFGEAVFDDIVVSRSAADMTARLLLEAEQAASTQPVKDASLLYVTSLLPLLRADYDRLLVRIRSLLEHGRDPNTTYLEQRDTSQRSSFHLAASAGATRVLELMLQHGGDLKQSDARGWTPAHHAAASGSVESVVLLLDAGAELESRSDSGETPLMIGAQFIEVLKCLHARGADLDVRTNNGRSLVHAAAKNAESLRYLVGLGYELDQPDREGRTPLVYAASHGDITSVKFLLQSGVDSNPSTRSNIPVSFRLPERGEHSAEIAALLREAGAERVCL